MVFTIGQPPPPPGPASRRRKRLWRIAAGVTFGLSLLALLCGGIDAWFLLHLVTMLIFGLSTTIPDDPDDGGASVPAKVS